MLLTHMTVSTQAKDEDDRAAGARGARGAAERDIRML